MRLILAFLVAVAVPLSQASAPLPLVPPGSKVWIGHYAQYEAFLGAAGIQRLEDISVGVTSPHHAFLASGGLAADAAWKPIKPGLYDGYFESYRSEIQIRDGKLHSPDAKAWNLQVYRQQAFDDLVADLDDNQGNMLIDGAWNLIKIDHSRAFTTAMVQPFEIGKALTRIDRPFFERLKALDRAAVQREIGGLLEGGGVGALMARRDAMIKAFQKLAASKGDAQVFTP